MKIETKYDVGDEVKISIVGIPKKVHIQYIKINRRREVLYAIQVYGNIFELPEDFISPIKEDSRKTQEQAAAVENADKRLKEVDQLDFAVAAIADYDNGVTTGFKDGAEWGYDKAVVEVCEWLKANAHFCVSEFTGTLDEDMLVKMLKEEMSNGQD